MSEFKVEDIKHGEIVYGCAFNIEFDRVTWNGGRVVHNICKPVKGIVDKYRDDLSPNGMFFLLKKDGSQRKSGVVSTYSRHFSKTYEESVEVYNQLVKEKQEKLRKIADELENELL